MSKILYFLHRVKINLKLVKYKIKYRNNIKIGKKIEFRKNFNIRIERRRKTSYWR